MSDRKNLEAFMVKEGEGPEMWDIFKAFEPILEGSSPVLKRPKPVKFRISKGKEQTDISVFITKIGVDIKEDDDIGWNFFIIEGFTSAEYDKRDVVERMIEIKYYPPTRQGEGESWELDKERVLRWYN